MLICITAEGDSLDSKVDPRFGRCAYFIFYDTETQKAEASVNPSREATGGAGIQSAQFIAGKGVKKLLTGQVGPNAVSALAPAGIEVVTGVTGTVKEAIEKNK